MTTLADLDNDLESAGEFSISSEQFAALPAKWLSNGFFTLTFPDGSHKTYRVRLEHHGLFVRQRTLSLLIGPINTSDYQTIGVVAESGFQLFRAHRGGKSGEHAAILWTLAQSKEPIEGYELLVSKRCRCCNRTLTVEDSIKDELGPICRKKVQA